MAKKKLDIIKPTPKDIVDDASFRNNIIQHVNAFGFDDIIVNVIEAYRVQARRFNRQADKLEQSLQPQDDQD